MQSTRPDGARTLPPAGRGRGCALRAEEQLLASEAKWRTLAENAPVVILTVDRDATVLSVNRSITGRPVAEYLGRKAYEFLHPDHRERGRAMFERILEGGLPETGEYALLGPDGAPFWFQVSATSLGDGGAPERAVLVATDINRRKLAEEALRESEQRFRDIVQTLGDWVWEVDATGRIVYSSPQVSELLGYTPQEMMGKTPLDTSIPDERRRFHIGQESLLRHPESFRDREIWHQHKDGRRVCLCVSGVPVRDKDGNLRGFRGVVHDVTERKREEEEHRRFDAEVQQARRVESLGLLAGGIAHDFNNLLTAILGNAELALAELPDGPARPLVAQIQAAGQHAAELTRQMLAYAGRGRLAAEPVDLTTAVREMAQLLGASIPKKVLLGLELADGLPTVEADPAQLRQVIMNLVINAADAIGDREGRITVRTTSGVPADGFRADLTLGKIGEGRELVCVDIADTGDGIAPDTLTKIFDPFFTTKFTGRGLGLAAVQGIVLRHGGTVAVTSDPGKGTTFRVCFPTLAAGAQTPAAPTAAPAAADGPWRGSGTVLVVDDEEPVRSMATRMLRALGFEVLTAADGREALAVAAASPAPRAVLLDLTMPHMDGRETFLELRRVRPELPVVLCSGYDVLESPDRFAGLDFAGFLQKPYRLDDLARALRRALGQ